MDNLKNLIKKVFSLRSPIQLILGLNLFILVLGIGAFFIVVSINSGALGSVSNLLNNIGSVVTFLNTVVTTVILLLSRDSEPSK